MLIDELKAGLEYAERTHKPDVTLILETAELRALLAYIEAGERVLRSTEEDVSRLLPEWFETLLPLISKRMSLIEKLKEQKPGINDLVTVNFTVPEFRSLLALLTAAQELGKEDPCPSGIPKEIITLMVDREIWLRFTAALARLGGKP